MGRLCIASALVLVILQESHSIDVLPGPAANAGNTVPALGPPSSPAAPAPAPDLKDLETEVQRLKARLEKEATALKIADAAAVGAMQNSSEEVRTRLAAQRAMQASGVKVVQAQKASAFAEARAKMAEAHLASRDAEASRAQEAAAEALRASEAKLIQARNATAAAAARAQKAELHAKALRSDLTKAERNASILGSFGARLSELPEQKILAVAALVAGALSVIGPTSLINSVFATAGSVVGGLMLGSAVSYFVAVSRLSTATGMSSPRWPHFLDDLMQGRGSHVGYGIWLLWALLGMARYLSGCRCQVVKFVPVVNLHPSGEVEAVDGTSLKAPLINGREEYSRHRRPPSDPSPESSGRPSAPLLPSSRQPHDSRQSSDSLRPSDPSLPSAAFHPPPLPGNQSAGPRPSPRQNGETPRSARSSNGAGGRMGLPKAQPSKSSGIFARMSKSFQDFSNGEGAAPGSTHSSGRPGGAALHV